MKIGILTHPLHRNYGGVLQCYALCEFLSNMGHTTIVIRRVCNQPFILKRIIRWLLITLHIPPYYVPNRIDNSKNIRPFIEKYIHKTGIIVSHKQMMQVCTNNNLDAVIVGSDQVWRADFAKNYGYEYFLDFVPNKLLKIAYAASFGIREWMYSDVETKIIKCNLSRFDAISVREQEGRELCQKYLGMDVSLMPDPTLLLSTENYDNICAPRKINKKYVFMYFLGSEEQAQLDVNKYETLGYDIVRVSLKDNIEQVSIEDWLSYIKFADKIYTDSFHGCVFSLIYEKAFKVYENKSGGYGRITSLLSQVGIKTQNDSIDFDGNYSNIREELRKNRDKASVFFNEMLK